MRKSMVLISFILFALDISGQNISPKVDYTTDLFYACDSIVHYEYGTVSKDIWTMLKADDFPDDREPHTKKIFYYENDTLKIENVYDRQGSEWELTSRVTYNIHGSDIEETSTGFFGDQELSFTENYNLDYIWTTKIAPIDVLSPDEAGSVLLDEKVMAKYENEMRKIVDGRVSLHNDLKIFTNTEGDTIRIEKTIQNDDKSIKISASNFLRRNSEKELRFTAQGDVLLVNNREYDYKYDDKGRWKLLSRGGYLIRREIF